MHRSVLFQKSVRKVVRMVRTYTDNTEWTTLPGRTEIELLSRTSHSQATVGALLSYGASVLRKQDIPEPMESVKLFIAHVIGKPTLCGVPLTQTLTPSAASQVEMMIQTRLRRVPIQYIIEEWDFCDLTLKMKQPVFIPRPETEDLIGFIKTHIDESAIPCKRILEIGCGSGAITLALLKAFPQINAVAIDKTLPACDLTRENASRLGLSHQVDIVHRDVRHGLTDLGMFDLVVSNPPYIRSSEMGGLDTQITLFARIFVYGDHYDMVTTLREKVRGQYRASRRPRWNGCCPRDPQQGTGCPDREGVSDRHNIIDCIHCRRTIWLEVDLTHPEMIRSLAQQREFPLLQYLHTLSDFTTRDRFCVLQLRQ